jgi:hypothetical protein
MNNLESISNIIHVIGDSHVCFFAGRRVHGYWPKVYSKDFFRTYHIGQALAYNLCECGTSSRGREKLFEVLDSLPHGCRVMLVFGEIDCRCHIKHVGDRDRRPLFSVAYECADRYVGVAQEVALLGFHVTVFGATPQTNMDYENNEYPAYGTCLERNWITKVFNRHLSDRCAAYGVGFISIFQELVTEELEPKMEYFADSIHLNQNAYAIVKDIIHLQRGPSLCPCADGILPGDKTPDEGVTHPKHSSECSAEDAIPGNNCVPGDTL